MPPHVLKRLRHGDHVAVAVGDGEGCRASADAGQWQKRPVVFRHSFIAQRFCRIDLLEQRLRVSGGEMFGEIHRPALRVGDAPKRIADLPRFEQVVKVVGIGRGACVRPRVILLQHLQRFEQLNAGRDRWSAGIQRVTAILTDDRIALDRAVLRQIRGGDDAAVVFQIVRDLPREVAAVKRLTTVFGQRAKRLRVVLVDEAIAWPRHLPTGQVNAGRLGISFKKMAADRDARRQRTRRARSRLPRA